MKKVFSFILMLALLLTTTACVKTPETSEQESSSQDLSKAESFDESYTNYNGLEFKILTFTNDRTADGFSHFGYGDELEENVVNIAIDKRNAAVEENYNIKIVEEAINDPDRIRGQAYTDFINIAQSQTDDYYMICPSMYSAASLAQEGYLVDLLSLDKLNNLEANWWDQYFVDEISIDDKLYFVTGDMCMYSRTSLFITFFNKALIDKYDLDNPYDMVDNKTWTIDKMYSMAKIISQDLDSNSLIDYHDIYGIGGQVDTIWFWFYAFGGRLASKGSNGQPILTIYNEKNQEVVSTILKVLQDHTCYVNANNYWDRTSEFITTPTELLRNAFVDGNSLFLITDIQGINTIQDMKEADFGILPYPLFDENQTDYAHIMNCWGANALAIPQYIGTEKIVIASEIMEALGEETMNTVTPAFYEIMLQKQKTRDPESIKMLDIIFNTIGCDLGHVYNWGSMPYMLNDLVMNQTLNFTSQWDSIKDKAQTELDATIASFEALE